MTSLLGTFTENFWAITAYFNPMRYRRRRANYQLFRQRLNVPLAAVELAYGSDFELQVGDADILIQLGGHDVLWQKERLLNVALRALPSSCRKVAWLDCDIIFETEDWAEPASRMLDRHMILQLFGRVDYMPPEWVPGQSERTEAELSRISAESAIASGVPAAACHARRFDARELSSAPGIAWAARRELLDQHGFYDACIIGGGDMAIAAAAHGCTDELMIRQNMNERERERYVAWARPYYNTVQAATGFAGHRVFHLWHGASHHRSYVRRYEGLAPFCFTPFEDIAVDESGAWRWNSNKPQLHEYVRDYFAARREDG